MRFIGITSKRMIRTRSLRTVIPACFVIIGDAGQRREARNLSARIDGVGRSGVTIVNKNAADHRQGSGIKQRKACQRLASNKRSSITAQVSANSSDRLQIQHGFARLLYGLNRFQTNRLIAVWPLLWITGDTPVTTLLKLSCPDRVGVLSHLSGFIAGHGGNLSEVNQFTDTSANWFFVRMAIQSETLRLPFNEFRKAFEPLAKQLNATWTLRPVATRMKVVVMVSKLGHCLADLLWRWRSGELACDIVLVVSN